MCHQALVRPFHEGLSTLTTPVRLLFWCAIVCPTRSDLPVLVFSRTISWWGFSPVCVQVCVTRWCLRLNVFSHTLHRWGFSPVCVLVWCVSLEMQATWFGKAGPKSPFFKTSGLATVRIMQWEMLFGSWKELEARRTSWYLLKPNGHGLTGIIPAPEQPCSPASSHGRLRFKLVIVTTAHAQSSLLAPFSVGKKLLFPPWVVVVGNNLCTPGIYVKPRVRLASGICSD